jgi:broad specificity phosphatase PhoE
MKEIIFIRHAESIANAGGRTTDIASITLSERGIQQAIDLAENFTMVPELVIVSPYIRTQLTAAPLIRKMDLHNIQIWDEVKEFTYLDKVKYFNTTAHERSGATRDFWNRCDPDWRDAEEESFNDLLERAKLTIQKLESCPENKIVVFSHGQFLLALRMYLLHDNIDSKQIMSSFLDEFSNFPILNTQQFTLLELKEPNIHYR